RRIINRERFKAVEVKGDFLEEYQRIEEECRKMGFDPKYYIIERTPKDVAYTPYDPASEESIKVEVNGSLKELSSVLPTDTLKSLSREVMKRYLFYPGSPPSQ
ncbi:MAG: HD domain-containing protein, partial [Candidatus Caldipriscus sp.]